MEAESHGIGHRRLAFPSLSLAQRMLLWVIPLALSGIFLSAFPIYYAAKGQILEDVRKAVDGSAVDAAQTLQNYFEQRLNDLDAVSESPLLEDYYKNREYGLAEEAEAYRRDIESYLHAFLDRTRAYHAILYLDRGGAAVARARAEGAAATPIRVDPGIFEAVRALPPGRRYRSGIVRAGVPPRPVWIVGKPVHDAVGDFRGAVLMIADLSAVEETLSRQRAGAGGSAALLDRSGDALIGAAPPAADDMLVSVVPVGGTDWRVRTAVSLEDFLGPLRRIRDLTLWLSLSCSLAVVLLLFLRVRSLTSPIRDLAEAALRYGKGEHDHRVPVRGAGEIAALATQFNAMAASNRELFESIRRSEARYRSVVDSSADAIIGLDGDLRVTVWSRGAADIFGYSKDEMLGSTIERLFLPGEYNRLVRMVLGKGPLMNFDIRGKTREGKPLSLSLAWSGPGAGNRADREWAVVIRDMTSEKALRSHLIEAEKLSLTGRLLSGVSHELNSPLTSVIGYSDIIKLSPDWEKLPAQVREDLEQIETSARMCVSIVENLLLFVRRPPAAKRRFSVAKAARESLRLLDHNLSKVEHIRVRLRLGKALPCILGSLQQIEQVFVNIIHNACQAMAPGTVEKMMVISARREGGRVLIEIDDSGPGVPERERERIFEPFATRRKDGTGLGLSICSQIVREHGGTIECGSSPLGGASFRIRLPAAPRHTGKKKAERPLPRVSRKRVLVVEDVPETLALMERFMLADRHSVSTARSGEEALDLLAARRFDLVIADLHLGGIGGISVLATALRGARPPAAILVTGDVRMAISLRGEARAAFAILPKPFTLRAFQTAVRTALRDAPSLGSRH